MAIKSSDQITVVDITDAYSVILTSEAHTFPGTTSAAKAGSATTQIIAMRGSEQIAASVIVSEITKPSGVTVSVDTDTTAPTLTISVSTSVTVGGIVEIPVHLENDIVFNKIFTFAIAFTGTSGTSVSVSSTSVTYQASDNGTTAPSGTWNSSIPDVTAGQYLWTKTVVTYSDGKSTTSYSVSRNGTDGSDGTSVSISSTEVKYQASADGTTVPTGTWSSAVPSVPVGQYLWTRTVVNYSDGKSTTSYSVSRNGTDGADGADAITMSITSSNGTIFKNTAVSTTLTAHVYKAGTELTGSALSALGTIKWYKDGGTTAVTTGQTLTIDSGSVTNKATYIAQLEE